MARSVHPLLARDHARLDALLARSLATGAVEVPSYEEFRAGLLRHIAIEEKVLFPGVRARGGADVLAMLEQLHADHAALASLLVPTPTHALLRAIRDVLDEHNVIEEREGGLYDLCDEIAGPDAEATLARMHALPAVRVAQHVEAPRIHEHIARMLLARRRRGSS